MVEYGDFVRTVINTITIRGLDTISIAPNSQAKLVCVGSDKIFENVESNYSTSIAEEIINLDTQQIPNDSFIYGNDKIVNRRIKPKGNCDYYMDYEEFTHMFVDEILETAIDFIKDRNKNAVIDDYRIESSVRNLMSWPIIQYFDERLGEKKIKEYIDCTSEVTEEWLYSIELVSKQSNDCSDFYKYEARFGIPSKCYPVAQATASVYFTYDVSRVKPRHCPVDVTFQFEASSCVMMPGRNVITEEMLFRIIDAKLACFKTISF